MNMKNKLSVFYFFYFIMVIEINSNKIHFSKTNECIEEDSQKCLLWDSKIRTFLEKTKINFLGLPESTLILTKEGPKQISSVEIGDYILSYDTQECKIKYTRVIAWIQKETETETSYQQIQVGSQIYIVSENQTIGVNENGSIKFQPLNKISVGSQFFGSDLQKSNLVVKGKQLKLKGKYSLMTQSGNYFILPKTYSGSQQFQAILLNCFPQLKSFDFIDINKVFHLLIQLGDWLNMNHEQIPTQKQYMHPLLHLYAYLNQNTHKNSLQEVKLNKLSAQNPKHLRATSSSNNGSKVRRKAILTIISMVMSYTNPSVL